MRLVVPGLSATFVEDAGNQFIGLIRSVTRFLAYVTSTDIQRSKYDHP